MGPDTPQTAGQDIDVDALLSRIEGDSQGAGEIPMSQPAPTPTQEQPAPSQQQQTQAQTAAEYEFTVGGKQVKIPATDPRVKQWLSQGYDYAQRVQQLNQQQELMKTWEQKYKPIDDYIQQDPQWWDHVQSSYQQRLAGLQQQQAQNTTVDPVLAQKIQALESKITEVDQFKQTIEQREQAQRIEQEDQQLTQQIQSIREKYGDLDWAGVNAQGKTLEMQVMEFGIQHGINNFEIAFKAFNHEALVKRAEERGKEQVAKERQRQTKLGLLGTTPAPTRGIQPAQDTRNKSYEDLLAEAMDEIRGA